MTDSYMARLGARLVDNGYPVLPIMPGTKKPGQFKGGAWRDYRGWCQCRTDFPQKCRSKFPHVAGLR